MDNEVQNPMIDTLRSRIAEVVSKAAAGDSRYAQLMEHLETYPWEQTASIFAPPARTGLLPFVEGWWYMHGERPVPDNERVALLELTDAEVSDLGIFASNLGSYPRALFKYWGWSDRFVHYM